MDIHKCITLDVNEGTSRQIVNCKPNDNGKRLVISLNASGRPYFVDNDVRAIVCGTRPDGFTFFNDAQIRDGRVYYTLTEQNTGAVGTVRAELRLYKDEQLIASPTFIIEVTASAMDDGEVIEGAEATALTKIIQEAKEGIIVAAEASINNEVGEPSVTVELIPSVDGQTIKFVFKNLKGDKGEQGEGVSDFDNLLNKPEELTEDDVLILFAEMDIFEPMTDENGALFIDETGAILTL